MNKYRVHVSYVFGLDLNIIAESMDKAAEIADQIACETPTSEMICGDCSIDAWPENFPDDAADGVQEDYE